MAGWEDRINTLGSIAAGTDLETLYRAGMVNKNCSPLFETLHSMGADDLRAALANAMIFEAKDNIPGFPKINMTYSEDGKPQYNFPGCPM